MDLMEFKAKLVLFKIDLFSALRKCSVSLFPVEKMAIL